MPRYTPPRFLSPESQPTPPPPPWLLIPPPPFLPPPPPPHPHHQNHFLNTRHSSTTSYQKEVITVGGLVAIIILCSILMLCGGRYNRRTHQTNNNENSQSGNHEDIEISWTVSQDQEESTTPRTARRAGATVSKEISLPPVVYHKRTMSANCAVCLEGLADGDECRVIPACNHVYHVACIDKWLENNAKCPLCRSYVWKKA